jgi:two-component system OmpR family sensor kinase
MLRLARWLLVLTPAGLGLLAVLFFSSGLVGNPVLYLRADLGTLCLIIGVISSVLLSSGLALWSRSDSLRKRLIKARSESVADKHRFIQRLDHELKNPLTAIRIGLANLEEGHSTSQREALNSVNAQVHRISRLTADLRKLSELETRPIERDTVDLSELLQQAVELAHDRPNADQRRISLTLPQAPWPLPTIQGDRDLLLLATHNLVDNALKFSRPGDTIEVRAFEDGSEVVVEIADTGPGIPEEDMPHIWEELFRSASARGVPGSGLGLALVTTIVQRHGGRITARSRAGHGTVFTFRIPSRN